MVILEKLKKLRKKKGYSQKYMADRLNLSNSGYAKIESGENVLSIERLLDILKILDVTSYNQILPAININGAAEIEKVVLSGGLAFENIHLNSMYVLKLVDSLCDNIKNAKQVNTEKILQELELISSFLVIIDKESTKHGYNFRSIKDLLDNID